MITLIDTGPIVALIDPRDAWHEACRATVKSLRSELITTLPILTEAIHLAGMRAGRRRAWRSQQAIFNMIRAGGFAIAPHSPEGLARAAELMSKYQDRPLDFADASLVALAEAINTRVVFTLDSEFRFYRLHGRRSFEILPD